MSRNTSILSLVVLVLCSGLSYAGDVEVMIFDHAGGLITGAWVRVTDSAGRTVAKLAPSADGVYLLGPALAGQKVVFEVDDPALGELEVDRI